MYQIPLAIAEGIFVLCLTLLKFPAVFKNFFTNN